MPRFQSIVTSLPLILGISHAVLVLLVFGLAIASPRRSSLLPIVVALLDLPVSILIEMLQEALTTGGSGYYTQYIVGASLYLSIGSCWFYMIGLALRRCILKFST